MIASIVSGLSYRLFRSACGNPLRAQARQLRRILRNAAHTDIGRRHRFAEIARVSDPAEMVRQYQREVPIRSYTEMKAELSAVHSGHWKALCPSRPLWFAMTAGSTGEYKYVPVTSEYRKEVGRSSLIFQGALEAAFPELRSMKTQFLVGSAEGGLSPGGIPQGFASGFNYKNLPGFVRRRFVLPYWVFTIADADERAYAAGRILISEPRLGALCAISPVNLINLRQALTRNAERLIADVEAGTLTVNAEAAVPGEWRGRPDNAAATALRGAWKTAGELPSRLLFPGLRVLVCWQGGNMSYYLRELQEAFGVTRCFEFPISASEGVFALPHRPDVPGGALAVTSHFLEFLPENEDTSGGETLRADQLQMGREYGVVMTNGGGLYRYDMEDIVRVTSFLGATPVIEFVSKRGRRISISNERITELDVTCAMQAASARCGHWFPEFMFVPCSDRRYRLLLDGSRLAGAATGATREPLVQMLEREVEKELRTAAVGYDFEREDDLLKPLEIVVTRAGDLRAYIDARQTRDALPNAQIKPCHLTNEFDAHLAFTAADTNAA